VNKKFSPAEHDSFSGPGGVSMTLEEVQQRIAADAEYVPAFWREKYEADAARNWDIFYSINSRNFFKVCPPSSSASSNRRPGPQVLGSGVRGAAAQQHAGAMICFVSCLEMGGGVVAALTVPFVPCVSSL
jgi:hypothetical protein